MQHKGAIVDALTCHYKRVYEGFPGVTDSFMVQPVDTDIPPKSAAALFGSINNLAEMLTAAGIGSSTAVPRMLAQCNDLKLFMEANGYNARIFNSLARHSGLQATAEGSMGAFVGTRLKHQSLGRCGYNEWLHSLEHRDHVWLIDFLLS